MKRSIAIRRQCVGGLRRRGRAVLRTLVFGVTLIVANAALAADPDLARAEQLVLEGKYEEAYDLLAPLEDARSGDATFTYLLGRAALGTKRPDQAKALFERSLAARPDSVAAHLALGRAYYALGRYAEAKIEFETVLRFDNLPPDLLTQVEIYNQAAQQSLDEGRRLTSFGYAETGIGGYRVNSTSDTSGGEREDLFVNARVGGGLNYELPDDYALDASLDYRFRYYDNPDIRNDSDWRWRVAGSRAFGENNLALGFRGQGELSRRQHLPQRLLDLHELPLSVRPRQPVHPRRGGPAAQVSRGPAARAKPYHRHRHGRLGPVALGRARELLPRGARRLQLRDEPARRGLRHLWRHSRAGLHLHRSLGGIYLRLV